MTRDPLRLGVAGLGAMGMVHVRNAAALENAHLTAVAGSRAGRAEELARQLGQGVRAMTYSELFEAPDVDAVVIATRTSDHEAHAVEALQNGKHLLLEKPGAPTLAGVEAIATESGRHPDLVVQVAYMRRHDPLFRSIKQIVDAGDIGEPFAVHVASREGKGDDDEAVTGGFIMDLGVHDFDVVRWLLGKDVASVFVVGQRHRYPEVEMDNAYITLTLGGGAVATCNLAQTSVVGHDIRCEVVGSEGVVVASQVPRRGDVTVVTANDATSFFAGFPERWVEAYRYELEAFVASCGGERSESATMEDDHMAVAAAVAARASAVQGKVLEVGPDWPWERSYS